MSSNAVMLETPVAVLKAEPPLGLPLRQRHNLAIEPGAVFYDNPNLWVRNARDNGMEHQEPIAGRDNWFYARVTNKATDPAKAFWVTFNAKIWAGTEFVYPQDFFPFVNAVESFNLGPRETQVVEAMWPAENVPAIGSHACILATVQSLGDSTPSDINVWQSDNLAQKNAFIVSAVAGARLVFPLQAGNAYRLLPEVYRMELRRSEKWAKVPVALVSPDAQMEKIFMATSAPEAILRREGEISTAKGFRLAYHPAAVAGFPVTLPARTLIPLEMHIDVPKDAKPGDVIETHLVQKNRENKVVGGLVVKVNVIAK